MKLNRDRSREPLDLTDLEAINLDNLQEQPQQEYLAVQESENVSSSMPELTMGGKERKEDDLNEIVVEEGAGNELEPKDLVSPTDLPTPNVGEMEEPQPVVKLTASGELIF